MAAEPRLQSASFRDPAGFVFARDGVLYRQVNAEGQEDYDRFVRSGLYERLAAEGRVVPHEEADLALAAAPGACRVLRPQPVPFVSYPYEWCFSQLKDAALATLELARTALDFGMILKDASAFNVQFAEGRPVLIDTLSFARHEDGAPWSAYRQFCQHFLAPLALVALRDARLGRLSQVHLDGVPLDLAAELLPGRSRLRLALLVHLHLHARAQGRFAGRGAPVRRRPVSRQGLLGLLDNLQSAVRALAWRPAGTEWGDYYEGTNYSPAAGEAKARLVRRHLERLRPRLAWDLGANRGDFSRIAAACGAFVVSGDVDPAAVEKNYLETKARGEAAILPLLVDLTNPTPAIGWGNAERSAFLERGPADLVLALALLHHLAISNNLPLERIAELLHRAGRHLIIEFVPKEDSQVQRLLATRPDIFPRYTREHFEEAFRPWFEILERDRVEESRRTLYLMAGRETS